MRIARKHQIAVVLVDYLVRSAEGVCSRDVLLKEHTGIKFILSIRLRRISSKPGLGKYEQIIRHNLTLDII